MLVVGELDDAASRSPPSESSSWIVSSVLPSRAVAPGIFVRQLNDSAASV